MKPGDRVGDRFVLEQEIGSGGMSTVYLGRDDVLDRPVAVKVLRQGFEGSDAGSRFEQEGRTAARLSHANVVQVYDAGEADVGNRHIFYIVMEYVPGGNLKDLMDKSDIPEDELARLGAGIAAGLEHAHERGVIHRDVKPQNVLMDEYGNPKLTDFGIARALVEGTTSSGVSLTESHAGYLGTALYSSPEQLHGRRATNKSDIYSLGVTLYHASVGEPPFSGAPIEVAAQQMVRDPEPPRMRGAKIGEDMERLIIRCMSREPSRRPDARAMRERLERLSAGSGMFGRLRSLLPAGGASGVSTAGKTMIAGIALIAIIIVLVTVATILMQSPDPTQTSQQAAQSSGSSGESRPGDSEDQPDASGSDSSGEQNPSDGNSGESGNPENGEDGDSSGDSLTSEAAAAAVANMYVASTVQDDYERSYSFLSNGLRREQYPRLEDWSAENEQLEALTFSSTPVADVSGRTAVVTADVMMIRDGSIESGSGSWDMVAENGEWRVDSINLDTSPVNAEVQS